MRPLARLRPGAARSPAPARRDDVILAIGFRLLAATCFAFMGAMVKMGHDAGIGIVEIVFYRYAFGLGPLALWALWLGDRAVWRTSRPGAHAVRAMLGLVTIVLAFSALEYLPVAEAITISFTAPLFAVALSALLLHEHVGPRRWLALLVGFAGTLLVTQPWSEKWPLEGIALALASALGIAFINIAIRTIGKTDRPETAVLWFTVIAMAAIALLMPAYAVAHDRAQWLILAGTGIFGGLSQLFFTASLRFAAVPVIAPFDYFQLPWAALLGWVLWQHYPAVTTGLGGAVIISAGIYMLVHERGSRLRARRETLDSASVPIA